MTPNKLLYILTPFLLSTVFCNLVNGQGTTNSPYSQYGIGEPVAVENGKAIGMAGTGIGRAAKGSLNLLNPASIGSLDSLTFYFDFGFSASNSVYKYKGSNESSTEGNFSSISLGLRLTPKWGFAIGFVPFSSVGYNVKTENFIEGSTSKESVYYQGSGGLSKVFMHNAYKFGSDFSLGLNTALVFGTINYTEAQNAITVVQEIQAQAFYPELGIQYNAKNLTGLPLSFGAVYSPQTKMGKEGNIQVIDNSGYILDDGSLSSKEKYLPENLGIGITAEFEKLSLALDYRQQAWDKNSESGVEFINTHKIAAGFEFTPNARNAIKYFEKVNYRVGFSLENSYLKIKGQNPDIYKATIGFGLPIKYSSMLNLGLAWEESNATGSSIIKQSTFRINLGIAFTESWFYKRKFE